MRKCALLLFSLFAQTLFLIIFKFLFRINNYQELLYFYNFFLRKRVVIGFFCKQSDLPVDLRSALFVPKLKIKFILVSYKIK